MKIEVIQKKFAKALIHINKAISTTPNIPVLANVYIEADKDSIKLSSTNLEIGINATIGANIQKKGKVTVSAKLLSEFIGTIKPGKLNIYLEGQKLVVESTDNSAEFFIIPADDFPSVPEAKGKPLVKINALEFSKALDKTTFSASTDNSRPVLTGLLTKITKRKLTMVGVDGYRLSRKIMKIKDGPEKDFLEIIPAKSLMEINKIIKDVAGEKDEVEIYKLKDNNQVVFKIDDIELVSRLIEGEFPSFEDILPEKKDFSFSVLKAELSEALKVVSIFARNVVGNKTKFAVNAEKAKLLMKVLVVDIGKNETFVDIAKVEGDDLETAYNARFLQDMITAMEGEEIIYETTGATSPGVFKDKKDKDYLHIIMPMRLE
ncbi:DNA polymerase III subunit beta [Candidatus Dojkabacteria bacterium]|nr:DNA polymerase III subunit beta [Candidatus Dojkabacteria bacterium]